MRSTRIRSSSVKDLRDCCLSLVVIVPSTRVNGIPASSSALQTKSRVVVQKEKTMLASPHENGEI